MPTYLLYPERRDPGGGHKQIRNLAANLRALGEESFLLKPQGSSDDSRYYGQPIPEAPFRWEEAGSHLGSEDLLFLPEIWLEESLARCRGWSCRRAVYAQGGFLALLFMPAAGYLRAGIEFMIAVSPYIAALAPRYLGLPADRVFLVPYPVLKGPFARAPARDQDRKLAICYMPRKLPGHITAVRERLHRRHPEVPWVEIDGLPEDEVAQRLDENAIFFSTQDGEGFGLPAIEAMARGCLVTGYPGTGLFPHPYATALNGLWARDRSIAGAVSRLREAIRVTRDAGPRLDRLRRAATDTAQSYSEARALEALGSALFSIRRRNFGDRTATVPLGFWGHLQAWRALRHARRMRRRPTWSAEAPRVAPGQIRTGH